MPFPRRPLLILAAAILLLASQGKQPQAVAAGRALAQGQTAGMSAQAGDLLNRARRSRGTSVAWGRIHAVTIDEARKWVGSPEPASSVTYVFVPPDRFRWINGGTVHTIIGENYTQNKDQPDAILQMARRNVFTTFVTKELVYLLVWPRAFPLQVEARESKAINGVAVDVLAFSGRDGFHLDLSLEKGSGLPIAFSSSDGREGTLLDYRPVDGVRFPFKTEGHVVGVSSGPYRIVETVSHLSINAPSVPLDLGMR
jgi:hypothetical protein